MTKTNLSNVIVALDTKTSQEALSIIDEIGDKISFYKIGSALFSERGYFLIEELKKRNKRIFLDLKYHDIPNTVQEACYQSSLKEIELITIHISGGTKMMKAALRGNQLAKSNSKIIGVSVLTSLTEKEIQDELQIQASVQDHVYHLIDLAIKTGLHGIVCSSQETKMIREKVDNDFIIINPGIRMKTDESHDQQRITTPKEAFDNGATYIVIGRPITQAKDKLKKIQELEQHLL